jgi:hypothetical protein
VPAFVYAARRVFDGTITRETARDTGHPGPKTGAFFRRPAFLYSALGVVLAGALGIATLAVLKRDQRAVPSAPPAAVEKAVPARTGVATKETPPAAEPVTVVTVQKGWTLSLMAQQHYGIVNPTILDILLEHNPQVKDVNQIFADEEMKIPALTEELFIGRDDDGKYQIRLGTFSDQRSLQALKKHPLLQGKAIRTPPRVVSSDMLWYRMTAVGFPSREEALRILRSLKQQGVLPAFAVSSGSQVP